jgi:hypothetical protein
LRKHLRNCAAPRAIARDSPPISCWHDACCARATSGGAPVQHVARPNCGTAHADYGTVRPALSPVCDAPTRGARSPSDRSRGLPSGVESGRGSAGRTPGCRRPRSRTRPRPARVLTCLSRMPESSTVRTGRISHNRIRLAGRFQCCYPHWHAIGQTRRGLSPPARDWTLVHAGGQQAIDDARPRRALTQRRAKRIGCVALGRARRRQDWDWSPLRARERGGCWPRAPGARLG